ncbi:MAG: hypothetical protein NT003_01080 [Candidatus Magasanikbacteria bacterium]|nr:hypothetical protein [Candidatus Magasanikbacteria bacterium]
MLELTRLFDTAKGQQTYSQLKKDLKEGVLKNVALKDKLAELISNYFADFRARRDEISNDDINAALEMGRERASAIAKEVMQEVREKTGLR